MGMLNISTSHDLTKKSLRLTLCNNTSEDSMKRCRLVISRGKNFPVLIDSWWLWSAVFRINIEQYQ